MKVASLAKFAFFSFVIVCAAAGFLGRERSTDRVELGVTEGVGRASNSFAIADFDGDEKPDYATVNPDQSNSHNYSIRFRLSGGLQPAIGISAHEGGLQLYWRDVNGDDTLDIVVRTSLDSRLVAVLLNDGHGNFTEAPTGKFPGLETGAELHFSAELHPCGGCESSLPSRGSFGGGCEKNYGTTLQPVLEKSAR